MSALASASVALSIVAWKNGQPRYIAQIACQAERSSYLTSTSAVPSPYQAGIMHRLCVQANTQGIARRSSSVRPLRHAADEIDPRWARLRAANAGGDERRPGDLLQVSTGDLGIVVPLGQHLPLLGEPERAVERLGGEREDAAGRRTAAAAERAATAVEEGEGHAPCGCGRMEATLGVL